MAEEEKDQGLPPEEQKNGGEEAKAGFMARTVGAAVGATVGAGKRAAGKVADTAKGAAVRVFGAIPEDKPSITPEQMYEIANRFAGKVFSDPVVTPKLLASKMIACFKYYDEKWGGVEPEVTIDCSGEVVKFHTGPCEVQPLVTMRMHADTAHRFWKQRVNLMAAVTKGEISAKGPMPKLMKLLPIIRPSYVYYRETLEELGFIELLNYPAEGENTVAGSK